MVDRMTTLLLLLFFFVSHIAAKKPGRPLPAKSRASTVSSSSRSRRPAPRAAKKPIQRQPEEEFDDDFPEEDEDEEDILADDDDEEEEILPKRRSKPSPSTNRPRTPKRRNPPPTRRPVPSRSRPVDPRRRAPVYDDAEDDIYEDDYEEPYPRPSRNSGRGPRRGGPPPRGGRGGRMVPYTQARRPTFAATFSKSLAAVGKALPDVKDKAVSGLQTARTVTGSFTAGLAREIKGFTSSDLEQVLLKATRPDDQSSKGKHVERLIGLTYQIPLSYDVYSAVLRKIWNKMAEPDWRTNLKAVYILHRFSADGSPLHSAALKARLRELRRMNDPKRKNTKYFSSKVLLAGKRGEDPSIDIFRAFVGRYAHYVLLRTQCFSGMFDEIGKKPGKKDNNLRKEHLNAASILLKAALQCQLKSGEECENTAIAVERVCSDMMALSAATATALNRAILKKSSASPELIKEWCIFYKEELLPKTKALIKKTTGKLDAYGLFLPSRISSAVAPDVLERGLSMDVANPEVVADDRSDEIQEEEDQEGAAVVEKRRSHQSKSSPPSNVEEVDDDEDEEEEFDAESVNEEPKAAVEDEDDRVEEEAEIDEEYEYDEEEFYDEE